MAEVSTRRLVIIYNFVVSVIVLSILTVAICFFGIAGGVDKSLVASVVVLTSVVSIAALSSVSYKFYRDPNYHPTFKLDPKLTFWFVAPVAFFALAEIFNLASGVVVGALLRALAFAGLTLPDIVVGVLFWLLMGTGMIAAAMFLWRTWKRFNALPD